MAINELNKVKAEVRISGKECDFSMLRLHQTMYGHHTFDIDINYRAGKNKKAVWNDNPEEILKELLGADITICLSETEGASSVFTGIIKRVNVKGRDANQGEVSIHGGSPTLLMTDDYSMNTFVDMDIASIIQDTLSDIGLSIAHKLNPVNNKEIPFVYRYKESSYNFLRRLLASCGETFWYDGKQLIAGPPSKEDDGDVALSYKNDMLEMNLSSGLGNYMIEQYDYDPATDSIGQWPSYPDGHRMDRYTAQIHKKSKEIYSNWTILPGKMANRSAATYSMMCDGLFGEYFGKLADGSFITGKTTTCKVAIGRVLQIETDPAIDDSFVKNMGRFRVVEVYHTYDNMKEEYINEFKGVNAEEENIPLRDIHYPTAMPEVARVFDNADPDNLGRVMVQFTWQQLEDHPQDKTSGWMRVQTPDGGSSEIVDKNRGFFFIPEIGDQVMVGYEYGDPNRPFVMGSLFHCNNTKGIETENTIKSISTKSGHTLEFNDDEEGNWGITIQDREGCIIHLDTKGKNIEITAPESMTLNAKNITLRAEENIEIGAKNDVTIGAESNIDVLAKGDLTQQADGDLSASAKSNVSIEAKSDATFVGQNVAVDAKSKATLNGSQTLVSGKKTTTQGAAHKIEVM